MSLHLRDVVSLDRGKGNFVEMVTAISIECCHDLPVKGNSGKLLEAEARNTFGSPCLSIFTGQFQFLEFAIIGCSV